MLKWLLLNSSASKTPNLPPQTPKGRSIERRLKPLRNRIIIHLSELGASEKTLPKSVVEDHQPGESNCFPTCPNVH